METARNFGVTSANGFRNAGTLKANVGKLLDQSLVNEIFTMLRDWANRFDPMADKANGSPTLRSKQNL